MSHAVTVAGSSSSNLAAMGMADNLDMKEMAYTPSVKDMTETRVRHMLTENMFMPKARVSECPKKSGS